MSVISFRMPVKLGQAELWNGLMRKAEDPTPYISAIAGCKVIEQYPDGLLREIVIGDDVRQRERVRFRTPNRVEFDQVTDPTPSCITYVIEEDLSGGPHLVLIIEGTRERLAEMYDYFHGTLQEIVDALHRDAEVNQ